MSITQLRGINNPKYDDEIFKNDYCFRFYYTEKISNAICKQELFMISENSYHMKYPAFIFQCFARNLKALHNK